MNIKQCKSIVNGEIKSRAKQLEMKSHAEQIEKGGIKAMIKHLKTGTKVMIEKAVHSQKPGIAVVSAKRYH